MVVATTSSASEVIEMSVMCKENFGIDLDPEHSTAQTTLSLEVGESSGHGAGYFIIGVNRRSYTVLFYQFFLWQYLCSPVRGCRTS